MLAQAAEQRGDFKAAEAWLAKIDDPQRALEVQTRRASHAGAPGPARAGARADPPVPERSADDERAKFVAEASRAARGQALARGLRRAGQRQRSASPTTPTCIYEQAMMAEKIDRLDEMERLLRRVIELKPDNAHAHNALGYSLADRGQRLPEARELIQRALELSPGDPFITDSLGWVEFRLGNVEEALRLLRHAYATAARHRDRAPTWARCCGRSASATRRAASGARPAAATPPTTCCARRSPACASSCEPPARWRGCRWLVAALLAACATPPPAPGEAPWTSGPAERAASRRRRGQARAEPERGLRAARRRPRRANCA